MSYSTFTGPGYCDACGDYAPELTLIGGRCGAGLVGCRKCVGEKDWTNSVKPRPLMLSTLTAAIIAAALIGLVLGSCYALTHSQ